jgi:hypothetical protein
MGENVVMLKLIRPDLILIVGSDAISLFDYFEVEELHGLNKKDCIQRINEGGTYIDGMCNLIPDSLNENLYYFIFINLKAISDIDFKNYGLIFHEATHYCFEKYWYGNFDSDQEKEEILITEAENLGIDIYKIISNI